MVRKVMSQILSIFGFSGGDAAAHRRKHIRYPGFHAEAVVNERAYSIRDWSMGGVVFETAPDSRLTAGDKISIVLKFRFPHGSFSIQQTAQVVRTAKSGVAAQFAGLTAQARRQFERVLDSLHAQSFLESQVA